MHEGQRVIYVGDEGFGGPRQGDQGRLLMVASMDSAHVQMDDGNVFLVYTADLSPVQAAAARDDLEDSLEVGGLSTFAVRETFEASGEAGVVDTMASLGHLAAFSEYAEEALQHVVARVRQDPSFREVLAQLDEEDAERVLRLASACLIRDAFDDEA